MRRRYEKLIDVQRHHWRKFPITLKSFRNDGSSEPIIEGFNCRVVFAGIGADDMLASLAGPTNASAPT